MKLTKSTFYGKVENGKLKMVNCKVLEMYVGMFPEGSELQITIERRKKERSDKQRRYYWGVIIPVLCDFFGYTKDETHDALKWQFLRKEGKIPTIRSTESLSTVESEEYNSRIRQWASEEFEVFIPLPDEEIEYAVTTPF